MKWLYRIVLQLSLLYLFSLEYIHPTNELQIDLGEHLLRGQIFFQTHSIPMTNLFSYTYPNYHWVNLEWLTETIFYLINRSFGINGLIFLSAIITFLASIIIFEYARRRANFLIVSYAAATYLFILATRAAILPEMFSYLFLSIFIVLLYRFREKYTNLIWLLIPLQLLWVNMHIYFIIGIFLVGLFLFEAMILFRQRNEGKYIWTLAAVFAGTLVISICNPYGLNGLLFPLVFKQNFSVSVIENFNIFQAMAVGTIPAVSIWAYWLLSILLVLLSAMKKNRMIDILISVAFILGGAIAVRVLGLFVFATFIPFTFMVNSFFEKYYRLDKKREQKLHGHYALIENGLTFLFLVIISALSIWIIIPGVGSPGLGTVHGYENSADFFITNNLKGPIFNNFNIGSYLAYRLYPHEKIFVDTNPEAYPVNFFDQVYNPIVSNLNDFQKAETKYKFNTIIYGYDNGVPDDIGFLRYLMQNKDWKVVYIDDKSIIFVKNVSGNEGVIQKNALRNDKFHLPQYQSYQSLLNLANFLYLMGWKKADLLVAEKLYTLEPSNCMSLSTMAILLGPQTLAAQNYLEKYHTKNCGQ
jgi:hypothetical protein